VRAAAARYWAEAVEPRLFLLAQLRSMVPLGLTVAAALSNAAAGLLPVGFAVGTSKVISLVPAAMAGGAGSAAQRALVTAALAAGGVIIAQQLLTPVPAALGQRIRHQVDGRFRDRLMETSLRTAGIAPLEDQESLTHLEQAAEGLAKGNRTPGDAAAGLLALILRYSRLAGFLALIGVAYAWWAAAAVGIVAMTFRFGQRGGVRMYTRLRPGLARHSREAAYFRALGTDPQAARELRIFGLSGWAQARYEAAELEAQRPLWRERRRVSGGRFVWITAAGLAVSFLVLLSVLRAAEADRLTLFALSLTLQSLVSAVLLGEFYHEADTFTQFGVLAARAMKTFEQRTAALDAAGRPAPAGRAPAPAGLPRHGIRFARVSFAYPGAPRPVFDGLDLTLHAGQCTAIVGLNGAGKTTLVKLLSRLYEPTAGAVLADGTDIRAFPVDEWRRRLAVTFQDFNRYELTAGQNIAAGCVEAPGREDALRWAAHAAGVLDVVDRLPNGMHTVLSPRYDGGVQLSGGQWQKLAIARALYAAGHGARVLVLDEPTAALDVRAEAAFYGEFAKAARGLRLTTLLISHRFATVRHADRIIVLDGGRVAESGTHSELVAAGGRYARLFGLQAQRFSDGAAEPAGEQVTA
jgi:ATP-binding cassette, subfamily B, bacterial